MQPTIVKTSKSELCLWVAPEGSYLFSTEIDKSEDWYALLYMIDNDNVDSGFFGDNTEYTVKIPEGDWEIIGPLKDITEEVAKELVDSWFDLGIDFKDYREGVYKNYGGCYNLGSALESLNSRVESTGLKGNVIILKRKV